MIEDQQENPGTILERRKSSQDNLALALPSSTGLDLPIDLNSLPPVDTEGGEIIAIEQEEQVDPEDNCKVHIVTYKILSADKTTEITKQLKRKLKMECTVHRETVTQNAQGESSNRKSVTSTYKGDYAGFKPQQFQTITNDDDDDINKINAESSPYQLHNDNNNNNNDNIDNGQLVLSGEKLPGNDKKFVTFVTNSAAGAAQEDAIERVLSETQQRFARMFSEQKNDFVQKFPQLFHRMRTEPSLFSLPSTRSETVLNPDGTTTTRHIEKKQFSSQYLKQELYVNGVRQECRVKTRAFMEYLGPEGGFRVKLTDGEQDEASEDEDEEDQKSLGLSEISSSEGSSAMVLSQASGVPKLDQKAKTKNKSEKAWKAAEELVETEKRYVDRLRLIDETFRGRLERDQIVGKDSLKRLFSNVHSLYNLHNDHILPQLLDRAREWRVTQKISDVMSRQGHWLKLYAEYTNNYSAACREFDRQMAGNRRFQQVVQEIERSPDCDNLPLISHLISPIQRVMRYHLLLSEYLKYLDKNHPDYGDTEQALGLALKAANHANEIMRKLDRYKSVLQVQEWVGIPLVSPARQLVKRGSLSKISSKTNRAEERTLFLFNDMLLLCSERSKIGFSATKYRLRAVFDATFMQVCEGDNLEREHSFYVRGSDCAEGQSRCLELCCQTMAEKREWIAGLWTVISDALFRKQSFETILEQKNDNDHIINPNNNNNNNNNNDKKKIETEKTSCARCQRLFAGSATLFRRRNLPVQCRNCNRNFCKKPCTRQLASGHLIRKSAGGERRVCLDCWNIRGSPRLSSADAVGGRNAKDRKNILAVKANDDSCTLFRGAVLLRTSLHKTGLKRYFVLRKDFCLYSFKTENDSCALTMLPMPGCEVKMDGEKFCFRIKHINRQYVIQATDEEQQAKWMAVLELAANADLPSNENT